MSERGVFAVDRGIWDHDVLSDNEPLSRREAWLWLLSEAAWKPHKRRIIGRAIELDRGQVAGSLRFIASKWRWSEPRVRRFLATLISAEMIDAKTDAGVTVITISKYDEYQRVSLPSDAIPERSPDAGATQERRKVEDREYKEDSEAKASGAVAPVDPSIAEREFFQRGRQVLGKSSGGQLAKLKAHYGGNVALARASIETASTKDRPAEYIAAVIRGPPAARPLTFAQQKRVETQDILDDLDNYANGRSDSGEANFGLLPGHSGERSEELRGGLGSTVIDLPALSSRKGD